MVFYKLLEFRTLKDKNMRTVIKYTAIDPYYSDQTQTFIGADTKSIDDQIYEFEQWLGKEHSNGIASIYKTEILHNDRDSLYEL